MTVCLFDIKKGQFIEKVIIHSIDLALYHVSVVINGEEHYVYDKKGLPLKAHNKIKLQKLFEKYDVGSTYLRATSAYDEMIGQAVKQRENTLEVLLGNAMSDKENCSESY